VIRVNGEALDFADESVDDLLARLGVSPRGVAVAMDGDVVARSAWTTTRVRDGAVIEVVTAVAGG
jgi:sulfur carrier protein